jgi:aspartyl-tRNA(Asn)/glutamyl-tRNA(Gln) amidotransferase subunit C
MSVTRDDVKHVAALARLAMTDERAEQFTAQLNTILGHMEVLARVDTNRLEPIVGVGADSAPLQIDAGPSINLEHPITEIGPNVRDGFFLVPRLSTHETSEEG